MHIRRRLIFRIDEKSWWNISIWTAVRVAGGSLSNLISVRCDGKEIYQYDFVVRVLVYTTLVSTSKIGNQSDMKDIVKDYQMEVKVLQASRFQHQSVRTYPPCRTPESHGVSS